MMSGAYHYSEAHADRAVEFFASYLSHVKGELAGQPFRLARWQEERIIRPIFGTLRADGTRRYRTAYIEIPRKNGKSTLGAGIALLLLLADGEHGAEVYSAAADKGQASIVYDVAVQMAQAHEALRSRTRAYASSKRLVVGSTASMYCAISAEAYSKHGLNASGIIFDELHAQPNRDLWDVLTTSTGSRRQPLTVAITTAGHDRSSICWELHEHARAILDGRITDDEFLPVIYGADEDDDWTEPVTWAKANPGLGDSVQESYLEALCARAQLSPALENTFRRLHLDQWTEQDVRWLQMRRWDACAGAVDAQALLGRRCYAGLDMATTTDLCALVLLFPAASDGDTWSVLPVFWVPRDSARERSRGGRVPYMDWIRAGLLRATDGNVVDYDVIRRHVNELAEQYDIRELAVDRWNSTQLQTQLMGDGIEVVQFGQGYASMSAPTKELEKLVLGGQISHGAHPVLRWQAGNVAVETDAAGNLKPSKKRSSEKIDGIVACIMALGRAMVAAAPSRSVYSSRGIQQL